MTFLIWSTKTKAWWKPEKQGYTLHWPEAGRYTEDEAREIVTRSVDSMAVEEYLAEHQILRVSEQLNERLLRLEELGALKQRFIPRFLRSD